MLQVINWLLCRYKNLISHKRFQTLTKLASKYINKYKVHNIIFFIIFFDYNPRVSKNFKRSSLNLHLNMFSPWLQNLFRRTISKIDNNKNLNITSKINTTTISLACIMERVNIHKTWVRNLQKTLKLFSQSSVVGVSPNQQCA